MAKSTRPQASQIMTSWGLTAQAIFDILYTANNGIFHVDTYGAKGDWNGTTGTDDTKAFNRAFGAAIAAGGGRVVASGGKRYRITHTVFYGSNTIFDGCGAEVFFDVLSNDGSAFMPDQYQSSTAYTTDVVFQNFILNGPVGRGNGIAASRARRLTMFNVGSKYLHWHMFDGAGGQQIKISNCWSEGTQTAAFQADNATYGKASWAVDENNVVHEIHFVTGGDSNTNTRDMLVTGCTVRNARLAAVHLHNTNNQNITITDNHFEGCGTAVWADDNVSFFQRNIRIANNKFVNNDVDVGFFSGFDNVSIIGNSFYGGNTDKYYYGVRFLAKGGSGPAKRENLSINNNHFKGRIRPVYINGCNAISVDNNNFVACGGTVAPANDAGIVAVEARSLVRIAGCFTGTVSGNVFRDCLLPVCISTAKDEVTNAYATGIKVDNNVSQGSGALVAMHYADRCSAYSNEYIGLTTDFYGIYIGETSLACVVDGFYCSQGSGQAVKVNGGPRHVVRNVVAYSGTSTKSAIEFYNTNTARSMNNVVMGGYSPTAPILLSGTTVNYVGDEPNLTIAKKDTATGVKVDYTKSAVTIQAE